MRSFLFLAAGCLITLETAAQSIESYIKTNVVSIRSIGIEDADYADLEAIGNAIGDKRVVMLGEQDHGDAPAFLAKTRLVKYLHEKKGFNVLAFESDFFALTEGQRSIGNDTAGLRKYIQSNIFPIWAYCDACTGLFYHYLPETFLSGSPVVVTGFDNQLHGAYSRERLVSYLDSAIDVQQFPHPRFSFIKQEVLTWTDSLMRHFNKTWNKAYADAAHIYFDELIHAYRKKDDGDYLLRLLHSVKGFSKKVYANNGMEGGEYRDAQMAANLHWLVNVKYKDEKIIVWAANGHVVKNSKTTISAHHYSTMGSQFVKMDGNGALTYVMGFSSLQGTAGRITMPGPTRLSSPPKNSFEKWMGDRPYAFVDFQRYNQQRKKPAPFFLKGFSHDWNHESPWSTGYDGIFYIRDMYPCKAIW